MNNLRQMRKGQMFLEYTVLIAILAAALLGMQIYLKRGVQGKYRQIGDDLGPQYSPKSAAAVMNVNTPLGVTNTQQKLVWLTKEDGSYVTDRYDLRVVGIEANTSIIDQATREGEETVGTFEASLFD